MSINIVLMAGSGKRFLDAGYTQNKALLPVSGKAMILQAVKGLPYSHKWVFVVREEHLEETEVIDTLKTIGDDVEILVDKNPLGQLNSCLVAQELFIDEAPVVVGACDFTMLYNENEYERIMMDADVLVFSFTQQHKLKANPTAWGWLRTKGNIVTGVSVKVPISNDPYNDFVITGSFAFKSGKLLHDLAKVLIANGKTVNGEFYIDSLLGLAIAQGLVVKHLPVTYVGWGTPADYEEFVWWEKNFDSDEGRNKSEYGFWKKYFGDV